MPVEAAVLDKPMTVTEKDQTISDAFGTDSKPVCITDGLHDAVVDIPASVSGDTIQVNSKTIEGSFTAPNDNTMEANGVYIHGGYTGHVKFADDLSVTTKASGNWFNADAIYLTGVERTYGANGEITGEKTQNANDIYSKTGKIAEAYGEVGKNTTLTVEDTTHSTDSTSYRNMAALESHFAHMNVGDGLNISVTADPAKQLYVSGLDVMYYGQMELGKGNSITVQSDTGNVAQKAYLNGIYSSHDHPDDIQIDVLGKQKLKVGDDTRVNVRFTSAQDNKCYVQNVGSFLSNTEFSFGDRLTIENEMKGSGVISDPKHYDSKQSSVIEGLLVQSSKMQESQGTIGDEFTDRISLSDGHIDRMRGTIVAEHGKIASLGVGNNSTVALTVTNGNVNSETEGHFVLGQGKLSVGDDAHTSIWIKGSTMTGDISGIRALNQGAMKFGTNTNISITADNQSALKNEVVGAWVNQNSSLEVGDGYTCDIATADNQGGIDILNVSNSSKATLGNDAKEILDVTKSVNGVLGHDITMKSTLSIGDRNQLSMKIHGEGNMQRRAMTGTGINNQSTATFGNDGSQNLILDGIAGAVFGNHVRWKSSLTFGNGQTNTIRISGKVAGMVYANSITQGSRMTVGNNMVNSISLQRSSSLQGSAMTLASNDVEGANLSVGNGQTNIISAVGDDSTVLAIAGDILSIAPDTGVNLKTGSQYITTIHSKGNVANINGMYAVNGAKADIGDNARINIQRWHTGSQKDAGLYGILDGNADVSYGRQLNLWVEGKGYASAYGIFSKGSNGKVMLGDDASIRVQADGKTVYGVMASQGGTVDFAGGAAIQVGQNQHAVMSDGQGSSVTAVGEGRKVILGDLESANKGSIKLKLNTGDSLFRGKSIIDPSAKTTEAVNGLRTAAALSEADDSSNAADAAAMADTTSADTELTLESGARWDMTDTSQVTKLVHENGGLVNMAYNPSYQRLDVNAYSGKNGIFRMKTDLASQTDGDKVYMTRAEAGSQGLVQVHDESFLKGKEVTGTKHLLLITDYSKNATFSGLTLDEGGLWDVTPTIQNGQYVRDVMGVKDAKDTEWYLTKLEKKVNKDTIPLMKAAGNSYALYRLDIDSLRKRMGDLRFRNMKDDSGIWARDFHGAYEGQSIDSRYNGFQLGYDYAANEKSLYGFFAERTISNPKYSYGSSKDHGLSGGLYGTWFGDSGVYTDVVAKWGRNDTELHTRGGWPDSASYRTRSESLSVEWGKTFTRDDGLFLEPEAQMVFGRLGSKDYTTSRGRTVHMGSYDSAIGRLGLLLGKRVTEGDHPYDYYLKFSLLHEFGGERNFHLAAPDGETMDYSEDYRDTWQEAGFGGTWHINGNTSIYADAERSFGGDWHKKWQWNLGINWQF